MFLVRTTRRSWSTANASDALAQAQALRKAGHDVRIETLGRRNMSVADLKRTSAALGAPPRL